MKYINKNAVSFTKNNKSIL